MNSGKAMNALWVMSSFVCLSGLATIPMAGRDRSFTVPMPQDADVARSPDDPSTSWDLIVRSAPFRASRSLSTRRYDATEGIDASRGDPPAPPPWHLQGVLIGDVPLAVFEERPGGGGATYIVTLGDEVGRYIVRHVAADSAVIASGDQQWTFRVQAEWP
jgi:hypothetical protein